MVPRAPVHSVHECPGDGLSLGVDDCRVERPAGLEAQVAVKRCHFGRDIDGNDGLCEGDRRDKPALELVAPRCVRVGTVARVHHECPGAWKPGDLEVAIASGTDAEPLAVTGDPLIEPWIAGQVGVTGGRVVGDFQRR